MSFKTKLILSIVAIINLISTITSQLLNNADLRFVLSFYNTGVRAPADIARRPGSTNLDIFTENWATPGFSELTNVGARQQYLLGKRNRDLYGNFISLAYDTKEVYVRAMDYNNTLMSTKAQMQGFYPVGNGYTIDADLLNVAKPPGTTTDFGNIDSLSSTNLGATTHFSLPNRMQLVPTHHFNADDRKYLLLYGLKQCPKLNKTIYETNAKNATLTDFIDSFNTKYNAKLVQAFNVDPDYFKVPDNLYLFTDTFESDYIHGRPLSVFTNNGINKDEFYADVVKYLNLTKYIFYNGDYDMYYSRITFSSFSDELFTWTDTRISRDINNNNLYSGYNMPKMVYFGIKDTAIAALFTYIKNSLDITDNAPNVPYASSFNIELYRKTNAQSADDYLVRINFNERIYGPFEYNTFKNDLLLKVMTLDQIDDYCNGYNAFVGWGFRNSTIVLGVLLAALFLLLLIVLFCCCCFYEKKAKHENEHTKVNNTVPHDEKQV